MDILEISHVLYHSKGLDESYPKMQVLSNLSNFDKSYGHLSEILVLSPQALTKISLNHVTPGANFNIRDFHLIWH